MGSLGDPTARGTEAETNQLLPTIAIAKTKETFIRDLISSSSDALDEVKKSQPGPYAHRELFICLVPDKAAKTLTVADSGVGMARSNLFKHVGAIARTGTNEFMEAVDAEIIGLRFYRACLVADKVVVTTKDDKDGQQYLFAWECGSFAVGLDADGERLHRGTKIKMFLKDEYLEYLEDNRSLEDLVSTYSAAIVCPLRRRRR